MNIDRYFSFGQWFRLFILWTDNYLEEKEARKGFLLQIGRLSIKWIHEGSYWMFE